MRIHLLAPLAFFLLVSGCAHVDRRNNYETVTDLIDQNRLADAEEFVRDNQITEYWGPKRVVATRACAPLLKECLDIELTTQNVRSCEARLSKSCDTSTLTAQWGGRVRYALSRLKRPETESPCGAGMRWGYERLEKEPNITCDRCAFSLTTDLQNLYGEFRTPSECEEKRLLDKKATGSSCHSRYLGEDKSISVYQAKMMVMGRERSVYSFPLRFKQEEACLAALRNGMTYYSDQNERFEIAPAGGTSETRFIGSCEKLEIPVCRKFEADALPVGEML